MVVNPVRYCGPFARCRKHREGRFRTRSERTAVARDVLFEVEFDAGCGRAERAFAGQPEAVDCRPRGTGEIPDVREREG
jgi:hypothetical protein